MAAFSYCPFFLIPFQILGDVSVGHSQIIKESMFVLVHEARKEVELKLPSIL